ncbi:MAG: hypothetical protein ACI8UO_000381 [Verrucomicrobiales bacterium]|jgi:hypothetical protein
MLYPLFALIIWLFLAGVGLAIGAGLSILISRLLRRSCPSPAGLITRFVQVGFTLLFAAIFTCVIHPILDPFPIKPARFLSKGDLIGEWTIAKSGEAALFDLGATQVQILASHFTLRKDGTASFSKLYFTHEKDRLFELMQGNGDWAFSSGDVKIRADSSSQTTGIVMNVGRLNGQLVIYNFIGDPDSWDFAIYHRKQSVNMTENESHLR